MHEPPAAAIVVTLPTPLAEIAKQINAAHGNVERAVRLGLREAVEAGKLLNAAKSRVERGKWSAWCRSNLSLSAATVYRYSRLAACWPTIVETAGSEEAADDLPILTACSMLRRGRPEREGERRPALAEQVEPIITAYLAADDALRGIGERLETAAAIVPASSWSGWLWTEFEMVPAVAEAYIAAATADEPVVAWMNREQATAEPAPATFRYESLEQRPREVVRKLANEIFDGIAIVDNAVIDIGTRLANAKQSLSSTLGSQIIFDAWLAVEFDLEPAIACKFMEAAGKPVVAEVTHVPQTPPATPTAAPAPPRRRKQSGTRAPAADAPETATDAPQADPIAERMDELLSKEFLTAEEQQETVRLAAQAAEQTRAAEAHQLLVNAIGQLERVAKKGITRCKRLAQNFPEVAESVEPVKAKFLIVIKAIAEHLPAK